jgi:hypothetical protein
VATAALVLLLTLLHAGAGAATGRLSDDGFTAGVLATGAFSGTVTEMTTGSPVSLGAILVFDDGGGLLGAVDVVDGAYVAAALLPGDYFALVDSSFSPELYQEIPCPGLACDPTTGTPITVAADTTTTGIDFTVELSTFGGIAGTVRDASTGGPLPEPVFVDVFDAFGDYVDSAEITGGFAIGDLFPGTYYLSSDTSEIEFPYVDELYDDLSCHPGGAFNLACDPLDGLPVEVTGGDLTTGIVIELVPTLLFTDGFESGDVSAWSAVPSP